MYDYRMREQGAEMFVCHFQSEDVCLSVGALGAGIIVSVNFPGVLGCVAFRALDLLRVWMYD